jgi:hypothetical protein
LNRLNVISLFLRGISIAAAGKDHVGRFGADPIFGFLFLK